MSKFKIDVGFVICLSVVPVLGAVAFVAENHFLKGPTDVILGFMLFIAGFAMAHFLGFLKSREEIHGSHRSSAFELWTIGFLVAQFILWLFFSFASAAIDNLLTRGYAFPI